MTKASEEDTEKEKFPNLLVELSKMDTPKSSGVIVPMSTGVFVFLYLLLKKFGFIGFFIIMAIPVFSVYYFEQDILWSKEVQQPQEIK